MFVGVSHATITRGEAAASTKFFGTSYMHAYDTRNSNDIIHHGDQTR